MIEIPRGLKVIYEPKGEACEYAALALNPYMSCEHACSYCYAARTIRKTKEQSFQRPTPRPNYWENLAHDMRILEPLAEREIELPPIHISFIGDPFQPCEDEYYITRDTIRLLKQSGLCVQLLTKAAHVTDETMRMLDERDWFGVTLTSWDGGFRSPLESNAGTSEDRLRLLARADELGIETWVSVEPIIIVSDLLDIVKRTQGWVDHYKFGPLNYGKREYTLGQAARGARRAVLGWGYEEGAMERGRRTFYLKQSLRDAEEVQG